MSLTESNRANASGPERIPVTDDQREIWLASELDSDASASYHLSEVIHIEGALGRSILESALQALVDRHDALRTTFTSDGMTQVIAPRRTQILEVVAVDADEDPSDEDLEGLLVGRILEPFDFEQGPLYRSILFERRDKDPTLLLVAHHIVVDGWSFGVLLNELSILYTEKQKGVASSLGPAMQYRDYVSWLNHDDSRAKQASDKEYWLELFREVPTYVELPADHRRPTVRSFKAGHLREFVGEGFCTKLKEASTQRECTLFQLMLASFVALLSRITGQSDIVVGIPHAGQVSSDLCGFDGPESLVGHCVSLLPIRLRKVETQSFEDLLLDVKHQLVESRTHQDFTFSKIAEQLDIPRDPSRLPLVSVSLNLGHTGSYTLGNLDTRRTVPPKTSNFFDLTIDLQQSDRDLCLDTKFNCNLYERRSVLRWLSLWKRILEQVIDSSSRPVSQLDLLSEQEGDLILGSWNATGGDYPRDGVVNSLFESSVDRGPQRKALVFDDLSLTFLELDRRANCIAHQLRHMGAGPDKLVGVYLERSPDMVAVLLAVLKSGAAYVPLDPAYPADRIAYVLEDSTAKVLVTNDSLVDGLGAIPCRVLSLDSDAEKIESRPQTRPEPLAGPEDLAYVIYTSGSTGRPKGVQIEHRAVVNFVHAMADRPGLGPDDVLLAVTTIAFDIAVLELFLPMHVGAQIVLASRETAIDPDALQLALRQHHVTAMQATPATWSMLIESGWTGSPGLKVVCGGEALSPELADQLLPRCGDLWNMYGPTETTVWSTCHRIEDAADINIGRPIANTQTYILDKALQPLPIGVPGELMIGGDGLARGYLGKPKLTAERFIANPFKHGQRVYRTGDLAKFRDDGSIECLGRVDFQVKVRGFRVELGEIESVLAAQAGIEQAVAVVREDVPGDKRLVAYVRGTEGTAIDEAALRNVSKATLPDYMVPTRVVALDALPLTPNGKVDRRALLKMRLREPAPKDGFGKDQPQGDVEVGLEALLKRILRVPAVGRHDNLFDIGGNSLLAVSYFNEIHKVHGVRLPVSTLLHAGSIAEVALEIEKRMRTRRAASCLVPIQIDGAKPKFFCVHGAGGNVLFYKDLSRRLGNDYPFFGLQARGLDGMAEPLSSIEEMANAYVEEIKTVQTSGPYYLGGYCLGGIIAYEIAQRLHEAGDDVALLALLDAYNFARMVPLSALGYLTQKAYFHLRNLLQSPSSQWTSYLRQKLQVARDGELDLLTRSLFNANRVEEGSLQDRIHRLNFHAAMRYEPRPYPGVVTNFKPKRNYSAFPDPDMGWSGLALDGVKNVQLDLNPHAMLTEPFIEELADDLSRELSARHS